MGCCSFNRFKQPTDHQDDRRFSRTIWAKQAEIFAFVDLASNSRAVSSLVGAIIYSSNLIVSIPVYIGPVNVPIYQKIGHSVLPIKHDYVIEKSTIVV
jgi:hypothetical protein